MIRADLDLLSKGGAGCSSPMIGGVTRRCCTTWMIEVKVKGRFWECLQLGDRKRKREFWRERTEGWPWNQDSTLPEAKPRWVRMESLKRDWSNAAGKPGR